jgi:Domain of unknown function (DUF4357)
LIRPELRTPGVYALLGPADSAEADARLYVGEGEDTRNRIDAHHANKDFWTQLIVFTSFGQALNKATIRYLEAKLLQLAASAGRAELDNGNAPALPPLSEPEVEDAESFLADMLVIYPLLGVNVFEPREQAATGDRLKLKGPSASGEGTETDEGFVVFEGALARTDTVGSMPGWASNLRQVLMDTGALVPHGDGASLRLTSNYEFKSPSAAAAVLLGRSAAGPDEWEDQSGQTLKKLRAKAVASVPAVESETPPPPPDPTA